MIYQYIYLLEVLYVRGFLPCNRSHPPVMWFPPPFLCNVNVFPSPISCLTSQKDSPRAASYLSPTSCRRRQLRNYCRCFPEISCDNSCHTTAGARSCRDQNMLFCFDAVLAWKTTLKEIVEDGFEKKRWFIFWLVDAAFFGLITYFLCLV